MPKYTEMIPTAASTTTVDARVSLREGNVTLRNSDRTSRRACTAFSYVSFTITSSRLETQLVTDNSSTTETGQEGFEPPSPGFGVRCSNRSSYWPVCLLSINIAWLPPVMPPRFSVRGMLAAKTTIFLEFKPIRGTPLIFCGCVVTAFTLIACQDHHVPHSAFLSSRADLEQ